MKEYARLFVLNDLPRVVAIIFEILAVLFFGYAYAQEHESMFILGAAFITIALLIHVRLISSSIARRVTDQQQIIERSRQTIEMQERSGKMLIRRDLELSRANERLRELDQLKTDFVTIATHQLRTPLSAVKWILSMLLKGDAGELSTEQRTFLMKAYESNDRMAALLNDMLLADRVESDKLKVDSEPTNFPDLIENVLTEVRPLAAQKNLTLEAPVGTDKIMVSIEPRLSRAIIQNLTENAIKYTPVGGKIIIGLHRNGSGTVTFSVSDTGIGMNTEQQKKIFTRFYRAENALKFVPDGSGLGLFIVKRIVEKSHGKIWFESRESQGSTFYVELSTVDPQTAK